MTAGNAEVLRELLSKRPTNVPSEPEEIDERVLHWSRQIRRLIATFPDWPHADKFENAITEKLCRVVQRYQPDRGNLALLGVTGTGKTTAVTAIARRCADAVLTHGIDQGEKLGQFQLIRSCYFVRAAELARAVRRHPLGRGDCDELERALTTKWLVIDDVGLEPTGFEHTLFEVVDQRYSRAGSGMITMMTSGFTGAALADRYGAAFLRRIVEPNGAIVESWGTAGAQ